ncbi:MAG: DUF2061 domain-containing protein [Alphaproteobacteria bacterium]|nr:DUF2061 domain-containing protein [Alphaproteobacteria bacterium]
MPRDLMKTLTYLSIHLTIGFSVAYALTGSVAIAGGIALIEPVINAVAFFFHEKAWAFDWSRLTLDPSASVS